MEDIMPEQKDKEKIIIIGSGPAGYTAAIYESRSPSRALT